MSATSSYDAGERIRVTRDSGAALRVSHGATEIATIKRALGDDGWRAAGDPPGLLRRRLFRSAILTVGDARYAVRGRKVKGLLRFRRTTAGGRPAVEGELLATVPPDVDGHAVVALATAAVVLGVDLTTTSVGSEVNGDNIAAAARYGPGLH